MISLDLMKLSEVKIAGDQPNSIVVVVQIFVFWSVYVCVDLVDKTTVNRCYLNSIWDKNHEKKQFRNCSNKQVHNTTYEF